MSARTTVQLLDDLDGSEATCTIQFAVDGRSYEIDLNDKHEQQFRRAVQKFVDNARRVNGRQGRRRPVPKNLRDVRQWAWDSGLECPARGRIPLAVQEAYDAAH